MTGVYEIPKRRAIRHAVTREEVEADEARDELIETLVEAIDNDPDVRAAILHLVTGPRRPPGPTPPTTVRRKGR